MMKDMDKKGDLPLSLLATMGKQKGSSGATQKRSPPALAASRYVPSFAHPQRAQLGVNISSPRGQVASRSCSTSLDSRGVVKAYPLGDANTNPTVSV